MKEKHYFRVFRDLKGYYGDASRRLGKILWLGSAARYYLIALNCSNANDYFFLWGKKLRYSGFDDTIVNSWKSANGLRC